jgi:hypothetical protein
MILTPEEQLEAREEIDYAIETHGYEYIWGKETAMDKTKGLLKDAPGKIVEGIRKVASNPTLIDINNKLAAHNAKLCEQEAGGQSSHQTRRQSKNRPHPLEHNPLQGHGFNLGDDHL